jgi:RNA polymerase sigma-70 factor, ECF subfamily
MAASDARLVLRTRRGDTEAFGVLVERHERSTLAAARHLLGDAEAARDATQEAFIEAYRHLASLENPKRFGQWLHGILRNRVRRILRSAEPATVPLSEEMAPGRIDPPDDGPDITEALDRLPLATRDLLAARYLRDMSYAEIARDFNWTVGTARVKCCHARRELRELLGNLAPEGGVSR